MFSNQKEAGSSKPSHLRGLPLVHSKKTVIKCEASLEVLSDAAFKESGPSPDSLGLTHIQ